MDYVNSVHLVGRVTATGEPRELPSGDTVLTMRVVVPRTARRGPGTGGGRHHRRGLLDRRPLGDGVRGSPSTTTSRSRVRCAGGSSAPAVGWPAATRSRPHLRRVRRRRRRARMSASRPWVEADRRLTSGRRASAGAAGSPRSGRRDRRRRGCAPRGCGPRPRRPRAMATPPSWWAIISRRKIRSASTPVGGPQLVELCGGGHPGHRAVRPGVRLGVLTADPGHRRAAPGLRQAPLHEPAVHLAGLLLLAGDDVVGDRAQLLVVACGRARGRPSPRPARGGSACRGRTRRRRRSPSGPSVRAWHDPEGAQHTDEQRRTRAATTRPAGRGGRCRAAGVAPRRPGLGVGVGGVVRRRSPVAGHPVVGGSVAVAATGAGGTRLGRLRALPVLLDELVEARVVDAGEHELGAPGAGDDRAPAARRRARGPCRCRGSAPRASRPGRPAGRGGRSPTRRRARARARRARSGPARRRRRSSARSGRGRRRPAGSARRSPARSCGRG